MNSSNQIQQKTVVSPGLQRVQFKNNSDTYKEHPTSGTPQEMLTSTSFPSQAGVFRVLISDPEVPEHTHMLCHAAEVSNAASTAPQHCIAQLQSGGSHVEPALFHLTHQLTPAWDNDLMTTELIQFRFARSLCHNTKEQSHQFTQFYKVID